MNCCTNNCNQGRECSGSTAASRAALGLPLHRAADWSEQKDEPILTMDPIEYAIWAVVAISVVVIVIGVASALGVYMPHFAF